MANNLLANPIVITNSMSQGYKASVATVPPGIGTLFTLMIEKAYWFDPANIGDEVLIGDPASGLTLLNLRCEVAGQSQIIDWTANPKLWRDFEINRFDSGTLYLYCR